MRTKNTFGIYFTGDDAMIYETQTNNVSDIKCIKVETNGRKTPYGGIADSGEKKEREKRRTAKSFKGQRRRKRNGVTP